VLSANGDLTWSTSNSTVTGLKKTISSFLLERRKRNSTIAVRNYVRTSTVNGDRNKALYSFGNVRLHYLMSTSLPSVNVDYTQLLEDETLTRTNENVSQVSANNLQQLYGLLNDQMKTFDLNGFSLLQRFWAQRLIRISRQFRVYTSSPQVTLGACSCSMNSSDWIKLFLFLKQTERLVHAPNGVHGYEMLTYV
jgi:hypothetical protein